MSRQKESFVTGVLLGVITSGLIWSCTVAPAQTFSTLKSFGILTNVTGFSPTCVLVQGIDGTLYGTARGGDADVGTIFKIQSDGSDFTVLKWFTNALEGRIPSAGLALSGNVLYGTTEFGGMADSGTIFRLSTDGTGYTVLKHLDGSDGRNPAGSPTLSGGLLYGTTGSGGSSDGGTVFKVNTDGAGYTVLRHFSRNDGVNPHAGLTLSDNVLYGTASSGGGSIGYGYGTVFCVNTDGNDYKVLKRFTGGDGGCPLAGLTLAGSVLYGTASEGGRYGHGTVFKLNTDGTGYTVLKDCESWEGRRPWAALVLAGGVLYGTTQSGGGIYSDAGTVFCVNTNGNDYKVLKRFTGSDGAWPLAGLTLAGSVLFGTTSEGGSSDRGTLFRINTDGTDYAIIKHLTYSDGRHPEAVLALWDNVLYGTTSSGGSSDVGTLFKVSVDGTGYSVLKHFNGSDGAGPQAAVVMSGAALYGTTAGGGSNYNGTVFKVNADGTGYTVLKHFAGYFENDGAYPGAALTLSDNVLYGTTEAGGITNYGTVFKLNTDGTGYTILKHFAESYPCEGAQPSGPLTLSGNVLYGTTGGCDNSTPGTVFKLNIDGTDYTVLKRFGATEYNPSAPAYTNADGAGPGGGLVLSDTTLFGTTGRGGFWGNGTAFKLNTNGTGFSVIKHFSGSDGESPVAGLALSGTTLYGTTLGGGTSGLGTVFQVKTDGSSYTVLKHLTSSEGWNPLAGVILSGSNLYGTTSGGGPWNHGTVFNLELPGLPGPIPLLAQLLGESIILTWTNPAFALQAAPEVSGAYTNIPGATSPYANRISGTQKFFRLIGN